MVSTREFALLKEDRDALQLRVEALERQIVDLTEPNVELQEIAEEELEEEDE